LVAIAIIAALLTSGCSRRELDCKTPRNQDEQQQCAHKASTEDRIAPTQKPQNWLDLTNPKR
jgi:hypothetical protein